MSKIKHKYIYFRFVSIGLPTMTRQLVIKETKSYVYAGKDKYNKKRFGWNLQQNERLEEYEKCMKQDEIGRRFFRLIKDLNNVPDTELELKEAILNAFNELNLLP